MRNRALMRALALADNAGSSFYMRREPIPDDVGLLLRVVAQDPEALATAAQQCRRSPELVMAAAECYILEMLLHPSSDEFRTLGVRQGAARAEIRNNMKYLMIWLHPDHAAGAWRSIYAARVLTAWRRVQDGRPEPMAAHAVSVSISRPQPIRVPRMSRSRPRSTGRKIAKGFLVLILVALVSYCFIEIND